MSSAARIRGIEPGRWMRPSRVDGVFNAARIGFGVFRTKLQGLHKKLFQSFVTADHVPRYVASGRRKSEKTVRAVIYKIRPEGL